MSYDPYNPPLFEIKTGDVFGFLTAGEKVHVNPHSKGRRLYTCVCGTHKFYPDGYFNRAGGFRVKSCGCKKFTSLTQKVNATSQQKMKNKAGYEQEKTYIPLLGVRINLEAFGAGEMRRASD
ncbi:hypothetical protein [Crenothrix polyspora]|uniref:Uncharacterized protein n=1 Tax=Crenothrix polyspora TaxID=360316 RepID=A0A1R4H2B7_9GAMM|nr:hypothetical protein [Crenothrix polyspora]SJM89989.1 hypothetical protein CRENPOLYSF1_1290012 [Crenothrix polyspora]